MNKNIQKYYRYLSLAFRLISIEMALSISIYILIYSGNGIILTIKWFLILLGVNWVNFISIGQGVQMGTSFADYIERKKTGIELIKRVVFQNTSGCNVTSHDIRPESKKNYARQNTRS